jgi:signal transduction histidine kinase/CheY-like chemotaxis protein
VLKLLRENLERGEAFEGEVINYRKGGKEFNMEWQISPLHDANGKITNFVATQHDITERKKLETQFRQAQKMEGIGQLAGGVAHDFNNILAVIGMQAELLKGSGGLSADQLGFADEINVTVHRAAALTRQLLLFSRREVFQPCDLDLSKSITNTAKMLWRIVGENIEMQLQLASLPMMIHADAGMMDQVLLNLAVNARDAMPGGGRLIIGTCGVEFDKTDATRSAQARAGSFVCLSVSDSGCGIPPEILPKIFEPFFTTKDVGKGTGLGLATVFGIVQQHQGWINVESKAGQGTTFRIYLPRLAGKADKKSAQPALPVMYGGSETILLAEDDPSLRTSLRITLTRLGYHVLETPNGVKAMEVWKENRDVVRLLLTDMVMPGEMTGDALAQGILKENPKLKVIYMSGYSAEAASKGFPLKEGVNFLTKPFLAAKLAQTIRELLDAKV